MPLISRTKSLGGWLAAAMLLTALAAPTARAAPEPPSDPGVEPRPEVQSTTVFVAVQPETDPRLVEALAAARANLAGQGLTLQALPLRSGQRVQPRAEALVHDGDALGVFWFDEQPNEIRVFLVAARKTAYVRRIPIDPLSREAAREAVWIIVESGSLALVTGQAPAMEEAPPELAASEAPEPEPVVPPQAVLTPAVGTPPDRPERDPQPAPTLQGGLVVAYLGEGIATPIPWQSGVGATGYLDVRRHLRFAVDYGAWIPWQSGRPVVGWRHRLDVRGGVRFDLGRRVAVFALLGGGVEALQWRDPDGGRSGWRPVGSAALGGGVTVRLVGPVALWAEAGLRVPVNRFAFVACDAMATACTGPARRVLLDPWAVRPVLRLGVSITWPRPVR